MEDQEHAERIFENALELDESERAPFLSEACRNAPGLRSRVEKLLAEDALAGSFLKRPLFGPSRTVNGNQAATLAVDTLNPESQPSIPPAYTPQFHPGELLSSRFMVVRFIAKGGMGEVYEVEDRQLRGVRLALKTVLSQFADDPIMQERFEREVLLAREVVHPNLCPIYDIFHWERPQGRLTYLTMKLLAGETLSARLKNFHPLPMQEATLVVAQVAAGLTAAHNANILHRDIKSSNIMLHGSGDDIYACVTDFGLARAILEDATVLTVDGIAGTIDYMAPELFEREPPSKASDVFAFGVVAYQVVTGLLPRQSKRVSQNGSSKALTVNLPVPWKRLVEGCLEPDRTRRFQSISEAIEALNGAERRARVIPAPIRLTRRNLIAAGATAAAALAGGAWFEWDDILNWLQPLPSRRAVALMAWPRGESADVVSTVLDSIGQRLARAEAYTKDLLVISARDLPDTSAPLANPTDSVGMLGANLVLAASLHPTSSQISLSLQLLDAATQRVLRSKTISFAKEELSSIAEQASETAARLLGLPLKESPIKDPEELRRVSPEVFQVFSEAEHLAAQPNDTGLEAALLKYQQAVEMDPHFALGYAQLAMTYVKLFLVNKEQANLDMAQRNASLALKYNPDSAKGLLSQAQVFLYSGKTNDAMDFFAKSLKVDPGNPAALLYKAQAMQDMNNFKDAELIYRAILLQRPNYWPAYEELGYVLYQQARYSESVNAFSSAVAAAPTVASPLANLGSVYAVLGKRDEATSACIRSIKLSPTVSAYSTLGDLNFAKDDYRSALDNFQNASNLNPKSDIIWRDIGDCYSMIGLPEDAKKSYLRATESLSVAIKARPRDAQSWATLAFYHAKIGASGDARSEIAKVENLGVSNVETRFLLSQSWALLGERDRALKLLLSCIDEGISPLEVEAALDLKELSKDPRYLSRISKLKSQSLQANT